MYKWAWFWMVAAIVFIQVIHINYHTHCTVDKVNCDSYCEEYYD